MSENMVLSGSNPVSETDRYRLLIEIADVVARAHSLPEAFRELAPPVLEMTGAEMLNLSIHDPRRDRMVTHYWKKNNESGEFDPVSTTKVAEEWAFTNQSPIAIRDVERENRFPSLVPDLLNHGVRSYTVLPLSTPARHFGAIGIGKKGSEELRDEDTEFLCRVAELGALALERDRAHRAFEEQQSLVAISRELSSTLELDKLLPAILCSVRSIARYDRAILCVLDDDGKTIHRFGDVREWQTFVNHGVAIPLEQSLSVRAVSTREVVFISAADLGGMNDPLARAMYESGVKSICSVPLIAGNHIWGSLNPSSVSEHAFGPAEVEYLQQVANQIAAALQNAHAYGEIAKLRERLTQEKRYLEYEIRSANRSDDIIGASPALKRVMDYAFIVADTDSTVLITGETGTGKERIARLVHGASRRRESNFIKLNCAAIPMGLLESELFGHEKGAFTGAVSQKLGRLELADKGTLLLDEIGEIPLEMQPKLLRVLQDHEFERLGGTKTIHVDVRLIAATNRDLAQAVKEKVFRGDLFYRLHVFPLHLPALRERREDIPMLIRHFVERCSGRLHKRIDTIPDETIKVMMQWSWPGNIRELENFIERSVILSEGTRLNSPLDELRKEATGQAPDADGTLRDREHEHIVEILRQSGGVLSGPSGAAARLGLKRTTLQYKMQRLGITRTDYLN